MRPGHGPRQKELDKGDHQVGARSEWCEALEPRHRRLWKKEVCCLRSAFGLVTRE